AMGAVIGPPGEAMEELDSPNHRCAGRADRALTGPHCHNWLNADEQGVDARRHVAFRSGSPKSLRAPRAVVTRFWRTPGFRRPLPAC
ncbi:hypothetical protein THAOC_09922, partial [Thalassiosira oceanica]